MLPPTRSILEAALYVQLLPCEICGARDLPAEHEVEDAHDHIVLRISGICPSCEALREYRFPWSTEVPVGDPPEVNFGGPAPSQLLDPGQWVGYAEEIVEGLPDTPAGLDPEERAEIRYTIVVAGAALGEALKFLPPGAGAVPQSALWTEAGLDVFAEAPSRFRRAWLDATVEAYHDWAREFAA